MLRTLKLRMGVFSQAYASRDKIRPAVLIFIQLALHDLDDFYHVMRAATANRVRTVMSSRSIRAFVNAALEFYGDFKNCLAQRPGSLDAAEPGWIKISLPPIHHPSLTLFPC